MSYSQSAYFSAGLTAQYGSGFQSSIEIGDTTRNSYVFREHTLDITAGYGNFSIWSNFEFSSPPRIGPDHLGLRKLRLMWESDYLSVSAGDLYGQFGRGLALNLWESQGIDWDSSLRGIWLTARPTEKLTVDIVSGNSAGGRHLPIGPGVDPRIRDFSEDATVSALLLSADNFLPNLSLGLYGVDVDAFKPWFGKMQNLFGDVETVDSVNVRTRSFSPGFFVEYFGRDYDLYVEVMKRSLEIFDTDSLYSTPSFEWIYYERESKGWGGYASVSYYPGKLGVTLEYKNYFFDDSHPDIRTKLPYHLGRLAPIMNGPTAFKEYSAVLMRRTPHIMDFEDEVGIQAEVNLNVSDDLFLVFNYAQSSRHTGFRDVNYIDGYDGWEKVETESLLWFSDNEMFYPFKEFYGEFNYHYSPLNLDIRLMAARSSEIVESYVEIINELSYWENHTQEQLDWKKRNLYTLPTELTLSLPSGHGLTLYWEHQWEDYNDRNYLVYRDLSSSEIDSVTTDEILTVPYYYRYVALNLSKPSRYSAGFVYDFASGIKTGSPQNTDPANDSWLEEILRNSGVDMTNKWFGVQGSLYLTPATIFNVFYGSLQGGLKCDSGVCVYVPGIEDAFTVTITSNF
ncbi:MAG: DUF6029 family protein [Candidatus Marinimicrobia bacterium]|nr:DUF6029 family protein [Candidatus Neomarinimicrobiota bacterium]MDP7026669.1 DUF6029 family protein [Candidatus Neomarinimicrobiota bacterium]